MTPEAEARIVLEYDAEQTDALLFPLKECPSCGRKRPRVETYFNVDKHSKDGLTVQCRDCRDARRRGEGVKPTKSLAQREDVQLAVNIVNKLRSRGMKDSQIARAVGFAGGLRVMLRNSTVSRKTLAALVELAESIADKEVAR